MGHSGHPRVGDPSMLPTDILTEPLLSPPDTPPREPPPTGCSQPSFFPPFSHLPQPAATLPQGNTHLPTSPSHHPFYSSFTSCLDCTPASSRALASRVSPRTQLHAGPCRPDEVSPPLTMAQSLLMKSAPSLGFEGSRDLVPTQPCSLLHLHPLPLLQPAQLLSRPLGPCTCCLEA